MKKKIFTMFLAIILVLSSSMIGNANESIVESKIQPKKMSQEIESDFEKFINFVEKNLEINNNRYVLKNIESIDTYIQNNFENISRILNVKTKDDAIKVLKERFVDLNNKANDGKIMILSDGSYYNSNMILMKSSSHVISTHWWGIRHAFYSRSAARSLANDLEYFNDLTTIAGLILPGGPISSIVGLLTSGYISLLVSDLRYWANRTYHFNADIAWTLNYRMYEN